MISGLSVAFDCVPSSAPQLDVVPLLPLAGWDAESAATQLSDVDSLLLSGGASAAEQAAVGRLVAARGAAKKTHPPCVRVEIFGQTDTHPKYP